MIRLNRNFIWRKRTTGQSGTVVRDASPTNLTGSPDTRSGSNSGGNGSEHEQRKRDERFSALYFMISVVGGWVVEAMYSIAAEKDWPTSFRTFCLLWFASAAAFFGGSILGFLFAVPKSLSIPDGPTLQGANRYRTNTNLEEVSDWLTKIILGLGLVNVDGLIQFTNAVGDATAKAIGPAQGAKLIAICSMIYGFAAAFIIVYSWTRTQLRRDFERSELPTLPQS
ncbi:hypothetical protein ABIB73_002306 [Bradyrhizobium sp. F1.4.3]|uniref:hypothetical protein n=1 Tax=Bradyrhizobium sp. F1.4.3 TaxID=3156356 RepID=UPI0033969D33